MNETWGSSGGAQNLSAAVNLSSRISESDPSLLLAREEPHLTARVEELPKEAFRLVWSPL